MKFLKLYLEKAKYQTFTWYVKPLVQGGLSPENVKNLILKSSRKIERKVKGSRPSLRVV
ncbi:hypothetical protein Plhal304r1_c010g0040991 [Plasmopara halstedii]